MRSWDICSVGRFYESLVTVKLCARSSIGHTKQSGPVSMALIDQPIAWLSLYFSSILPEFMQMKHVPRRQIRPNRTKTSSRRLRGRSWSRLLWPYAENRVEQTHCQQTLIFQTSIFDVKKVARAVFGCCHVDLRYGVNLRLTLFYRSKEYGIYFMVYGSNWLLCTTLYKFDIHGTVLAGVVPVLPRARRHAASW